MSTNKLKFFLIAFSIQVDNVANLNPVKLRFSYLIGFHFFFGEWVFNTLANADSITSSSSEDEPYTLSIGRGVGIHSHSLSISENCFYDQTVIFSLSS